MGNILNKSDIRKTIRDQRKKLSPEQVEVASEKIAEKIIQLPEFLNSKNIAYYVSHENEINSEIIIQRACELHQSLYLPVLSQENTLYFYSINSNTQFVKNKFGIEEPIILNQSPVSLAQLDLILIPLVAFDADCNRLGRGAGYYDRALAATKNIPRDQRPVLIGLAYEFQKVDSIISESWDVRMDFIVTEKAVYE